MDETWRDDKWDEQGMYARRLVHERTNTQSVPRSKKRRHMCMHEQSSKHQDHQRIHTPCHAKVKLWYTKSTLITQQHYNSTWTPTIAWTYLLCRVESCHESSRAHHYCGPYCCNQCNVTWKSKRPTGKCEESCKFEGSCKSNSHEGSWTVRRANFTLVYKYPSFVHAKYFSPWLLPHSLESLFFSLRSE